MKRTPMNIKANRLIKDKIKELGLDHCEFPGCHKRDTLTIAHRYPRRYFKTAEELANRKFWMVACIEHHHYLDHTPEGIRRSEEIFTRVLGKAKNLKMVE